MKKAIAAVIALGTIVAILLSNHGRILGHRAFIVVTGSMEPAIKTYAVVICKEESIKNINVGDIIIFEVRNEKIAHRVIGSNGAYVTTKGDANKNEDGIMILDSELEGKVVAIWNWTSGFIGLTEKILGGVTNTGIVIVMWMAIGIMLGAIEVIRLAVRRLRKHNDAISNRVEKQVNSENVNPKMD